MESNTLDLQVRTFALELYRAMGSPVAKAYEKALLDGDWEFIRTNRIDPRSYDNYDRFVADYLSQEFLRKYPGLPGSTNATRKRAAEASFLENEKRCYESNQRLYGLVYLTREEPQAILDFVSRVRKIVSSVIGTRPPEDLPEMGDFGPGSTYDDRGKHILLPDKLCSSPTMTAAVFDENYDLMIDFLIGWGRVSKHPTSVEGNRFSTVPKDSQTDRGISVEPSVNLFYQKAVGNFIRDRLRRVGIDLVEGQRNHMRLCMSALEQGLCTIDLSSASDTMCRALVQLLLPRLWFDLLDSLRSPRTKFKGKQVYLEKFSSMGNGFTFELETLLFYSISRACCSDGETVSVYGDDIIVPVERSRTVLAALKYFGFTPNSRKTFTTGLFRESCGADVFAGRMVNAVRLDGELQSHLDLISLYNRVTWCFDIAGLSHKSHALRRKILSQVPTAFKLFGPSDFGDAVIHSNSSKWTTKRGEDFCDPKGYGITTFYTKKVPGTLWLRVLKTTTEGIPWSHWSEDVELASRVFRVGDNSTGSKGRGCRTHQGYTWVSVS